MGRAARQQQQQGARAHRLEQRRAGEHGAGGGSDPGQRGAGTGSGAVLVVRRRRLVVGGRRCARGGGARRGGGRGCRRGGRGAGRGGGCREGRGVSEWSSNNVGRAREAIDEPRAPQANAYTRRRCSARESPPARGTRDDPAHFPSTRSWCWCCCSSCSTRPSSRRPRHASWPPDASPGRQRHWNSSGTHQEAGRVRASWRCGSWTRRARGVPAASPGRPA